MYDWDEMEREYDLWKARQRAEEAEREAQRVRRAYRAELAELHESWLFAEDRANHLNELLANIVQAYRACGGELTEQLREAIEAAANEVEDDEEVA